MWDNLEYVVLKAVGDATATDMYGYYKNAGYFFWETTVIWNKFSNIIAMDEWEMGKIL